MADETNNVTKDLDKEVKQEEDIIQIAEEERKKLDEARIKLDESIKKSEKFVAESILRGKSWAGQQIDPMDEFKENAERYAKALGRTFK